MDVRPYIYFIALVIYLILPCPILFTFSKMLSSILFSALGLPSLVFSHPSTSTPTSTEISTLKEKVCVVEPCADGGDSAPAIIQAFQECGHNDGITTHGTVLFKNTTYNIQSVMNTTGLSHVNVDLQGTLLWDTNIPYWLNNSLPVGYQNQSSAWLFGGNDIHWDGHGYGTLNGNGEVWYEYINGTNNYPGRPHQITYTGVTDCVFENIRFVQSQMWTMTVIYAQNILLENIYVNSTGVQPVGFDFSSLNVGFVQFYSIYLGNKLMEFRLMVRTQFMRITLHSAVGR